MIFAPPGQNSFANLEVSDDLNHSVPYKNALNNAQVCNSRFVADLSSVRIP